MNEQLKLALQQIITDMNTAKTFAIEQVPDVVQQMVTYHIIISLLVISLTLVSLVITFIVFTNSEGRLFDKHDNPTNYGWVFFMSLVSSLVMFIICTAGNHIQTFISATFTPKWFITQKIMELM